MGWVYNLKDQNAPTTAPRLIAICMTFSAFALLAVALRFHMRLQTEKGLWVDDYTSLFSAVLVSGYAAIAVVQTRYGQALDPAYFPPENVIGFSEVQYAGRPVYTLALLGFKIALLTSYLRIGGFVRAYRITIYIAIALVTCNQIIFTLASKQWNASEPGWCIDTVKSYYDTSLGFDIIIIILPFRYFGGCDYSSNRSLFALGFFITAIQVIRMFTIANLKSYTDSHAIIMWSVLEVSLGVIVTCVPTYAPLFTAFSARINSYCVRRREELYRLSSTPRHTAGFGYREQNDSSRARSSQNLNSGPDEEEEQAMHTARTSLSRQDSRGDALSEGYSAI